jgi:DNA-binding response OmpR family regulator
MSASVLIVDDDVMTCAGMAELLRHAGHDAQAATTFEDARAILARRTPDLLIVDIRLGEFNGLQLIMLSRTQIPAIVISGFADPLLEHEARQAGAEFLVKPVVPAELLALVQQKLSHAPVPATPRL